MKDIAKSCKVALVQAEPCMFDKKASLEKTLKYIEEAALKKPDLIVFPELFIPGYPIGMNFGFSMGKRTEPGREDWKRYYDQTVVVRALSTFDLAERTSDSYWRSSILYKGWPFSTGAPDVKYFSTISPETRGLIVTALVDLICPE